MSKLLDLTGQRFGRLVVIQRAENTKGGKARWRCQCDCGQEIIVDGKHLRRGETQSCGCLQKEKTRKSHTTHGATDTRLYNIWDGMKSRCYNRNSSSYADYGGRGITVCEEWRNDFTTFQNWALSHGYRDDLTIDRINFNGNYEPSNCRWADWIVQANNRRPRKSVQNHNEEGEPDVVLPFLLLEGRNVTWALHWTPLN